MAISYVWWQTLTKLECIDTLDSELFICVTPSKIAPGGANPFAIEGYLNNWVPVKGDAYYRYNLRYDDSQLVAGAKLVATDILGVICKDCLTDWAEGNTPHEVDPIFSASPAFTITNADIANWNAGGGGGEPLFTAWLAGPPAISIFTNDVGYLTVETDPVFNAWLSTPPNISIFTNDAGYLTAVTPHDILSATHGDTTAAAVVQGDIIVGSATPKWERLAANATGTNKFLRSVSGGVPSWEVVTGTVSFGTTTQIPYMNVGGTDFLYSANLTFNGSAFACQASAVFNEAGADVDFRIEGDTDANLFMLDASTDRIGIGIAAPLAKLHTYRYLGTRDGDARHYRAQEYVDWAGAVGNCWFLDCDITDYRRLNSGTTDHVYCLDINYNRNSAATLSTAINSYVDAFPLTIIDNANFTATDHSYLTHRGGNVQITQNYKVNLTAGKNLTYIGVAYDTYLQSTAPTVTTGNLNAYYYAFRAAGIGHTSGTHRGYSFYNSMTGFDELWCLYNNTASPSLLGLDSSKQYLGTGLDAYFEYDGTNLLCNPKAVGAGMFDVLGTLQTDGYNAADGTAGASTTTGGLTFKNGLYTSGLSAGVTGSGTANQVAYWSSSSAITGSANLTFSGTVLNLLDAASLTIGTGADLKIYTSGDNTYFAQQTSDKDIFFSINDGGTVFTLLQLDSSISKVVINAKGDISIPFSIGNTITRASGTSRTVASFISYSDTTTSFSPISMTGMNFSVRNYRPFSSNNDVGDLEQSVMVGVDADVYHSRNISGTDVGYYETNYGAYYSMTLGGTISFVPTEYETNIYSHGVFNSVIDNRICSGTTIYTYDYGGLFNCSLQQSSPETNGGIWYAELFGFRASVYTAGARNNGYSKLYGAQIEVQGNNATEAWGIYAIGTNGTVNNFFGNDNQKNYVGTGYDAYFEYNGTNLICNPKALGAGIFDVLGTLQTDGYNAADGTAGASGTITLAAITTITVKNGLITAWS